MEAQTLTAEIGHNLPPDTAAIQREGLDEKHGALISRRDELLAASERVPATVDDEDAAGRVQDVIKQPAAAAKAAEGARVAANAPDPAARRTAGGW